MINHFVCCVYVTKNYHMPMTNTSQHEDYEKATPPGKSCSAGGKLINMEPLGVMQVANSSTCPLLNSRFQVVEISRCREFVKICINIVEGVCSPLSRAQLFESRLALNSGLNLTRVFLIVFESIFSDNFLCYF